MAKVVSKRSPCVLRQAGAVVVSFDNRLIAVGYNGMPAGMRPPIEPLIHEHRLLTHDCRDYCERSRDGDAGRTNSYENCFSIHAEANALLVCDRRDREGGTIYMYPGISCWDCAKWIANSGLTRVVAFIHPERDAHRSSRVLELWDAVDIEFTEWTFS